MEIWATGDGFAVGMMRLGKWEPQWNKDDGSLQIVGDREYPVSVTTNRGMFIECLDEGGNVLCDGGDGSWFYVPAGKETVSLRYKQLPDPALTATEVEAARKTTTVYVARHERHDDGPFEFGASYTDGTLNAVIESLDKIRDSIPREYRAKARCEIDSESGYEGSHYASIEVSYVRPETDEEVVARVKIERERSRIERLTDEAKLRHLKKKLDAH